MARPVRERVPAGPEPAGVKLTRLTPKQAAYIVVPVEGRFTPDHDRYEPLASARALG